MRHALEAELEMVARARPETGGHQIVEWLPPSYHADSSLVSGFTWIIILAAVALWLE